MSQLIPGAERSLSRTSMCPYRAARCRAVAPRKPLTFTSTLALSKKSTTSKCPSLAAQINGVFPEPSVLFSSSAGNVPSVSKSAAMAALAASVVATGTGYFFNGPPRSPLMSKFCQIRPGSWNKCSKDMSASLSLPPSTYFLLLSNSAVLTPAALPKPTSFEGLSPTIKRSRLTGRPQRAAIALRAVGSGFAGKSSSRLTATEKGARPAGSQRQDKK
mmetsp:Transcript_53734/g.96602  ORF Transcript_53734/g.96602 Transcript_53734/m.96602 type:complete len:217 (-) Transcript_53734:416-1066(-)